MNDIKKGVESRQNPHISVSNPTSEDFFSQTFVALFLRHNDETKSAHRIKSLISLEKFFPL
jgi:hypothetical protein